MRKVLVLVASLGAALLVAGCGSGSSSSGGSGSPSPGGASAADAVLTTRESPLGPIVVDAQGRAVYVFDKDTADSGTSACSGPCLDNWPPVTADSASPAVDGVTGKVGTITRDDGTTQVTLDGLPLYTFAGDAEPGDVNGQGVQGVWWLVSPDGAKLTASPAAPPPGY